MTEEIIQLKDPEPPREQPVETQGFQPAQPVAFKRTFVRTATTFQGRSYNLAGDFFSSSSTVTSIGVTVTETNLVTLTLPDKKLYIGQVIRITARGTYSNTNGADTITIRVTFGTSPPGTDTVANNMVSTAAVATDQPWNLSWIGIITSLGSSGTIECQLEGSINNVKKDNANTAATTIDATVVQTFAITGQWSAATAGNTISIRQLVAEII